MLVLLLTVCSLVSAGKILIYNPTYGHSHVRFLGNLADLYAEDGHDVTVFSPVVDDHVEPIGTTNPKVKKIIYHSKYVDVNDWKTMDIKRPTFWTTPVPHGMSMDWNVWDVFIKTMSNVYRGLLEDKEMMDYLIKEQFDLGVLEIFEVGGVGLFEVLGIRANIVAAALGMIFHHYTLTGIPYYPSFVPDFITTFDGEMTFLERLINLRATWHMTYRFQGDVEMLHEIYRKHYPDFPDIRELLVKRSGIIFTNTNEFTESPRLKSNMIQYVGGTNVHPAKAVAPEVENLLALRAATIFFSLGSFVQACSMPLDYKMEILEAFGQFPDVTFLWKYESSCENDSAPFDQFPNVIRREWFPQSDLLGDHRVKGFITHAGMNSLLEVGFRGKPVISIPLFADQYINARNAARLGLAILIDRSEISKERLVAALQQLLDPDSPVARKASLAAEVLKGKDEEYRQAALHWARLLVKHGPLEHLQLPTMKLNFFQLHSLDCIALILSILVLILVVPYYFVKFLWVLSIRVVSKGKRKSE